MDNFWQYISYRKHCNERRLNMLRKIVFFLVGALPQTPLGELTALSQTL